jgi:cysteine desulfurase/selenocysteine lyase
MPLPRKSPTRCSIACNRPIPPNTPTYIGVHFLANAATKATKVRAKKYAAFQCRAEGIFTRNATEAINLVAYTFGRERIKAGDEIVLSIMEHHSISCPGISARAFWRRHQMGAGRRRRKLPARRVRKSLNPRTKLVAIANVEYAGTVVPVKEVTRLAHARGIPVGRWRARRRPS